MFYHFDFSITSNQGYIVHVKSKTTYVLLKLEKNLYKVDDTPTLHCDCYSYSASMIHSTAKICVMSSNPPLLVPCTIMNQTNRGCVLHNT